MIVQSEIQINAAPSIVWGVTEDVEVWSQWTPTIESAVRLDAGPFDVGSRVRIKQPGLPEAVWRVTALSKGNSFTWETRVLGIRMVATHDLLPCDSGTKCILRLEVLGIVAVLLWPLISRSARSAIAQENVSLKALCEALPPTL
jgi:Polyketide cyclase / dehydrase and lipid transport